MDLHVEEDPRFSRFERRVSKVGTAGMLALIVAAAIGLLGDGPLSRATATHDGLRVEYPRFARRQTRSVVQVRLAPAVASESRTITISRSLVDPRIAEQFMPEPDEVQVRNDVAQLDYEQAPQVLSIWLRPQDPGLLSGDIDVLGSRVHVDTLVFP